MGIKRKTRGAGLYKMIRSVVAVLFLVCVARAFDFNEPLDDNIVEEVKAGTDKIRQYIKQVERRARVYRDRAARWLKHQEEMQTKFFQNRSVYFEDRVARRLQLAQTEEETQNILLEERERVKKAKADINKGLTRAGYDILNAETAAINDLEKALKKATVDIFKGVRKSRYDYRQGLYTARKDLREADDVADADLDVVDIIREHPF